MKINTDGVLLGAMAQHINPQTILDIGTGTGVIALMLAQRFPDAVIDAVEIDQVAADTSLSNFAKSQFVKRMALFAMGFEAYSEQFPDRKYDLIVSNPPFFLNSLESPGPRRNLARHANNGFYKNLVVSISQHLSDSGTCQLILPLETASLVEQLLPASNLYLQKQICINSYPNDQPHRKVLVIGRDKKSFTESTFVIYDQPKIYSSDYQCLLKDFLTIF
ncbi:tRNA1(Val) (adenine(37)-N6)-methyltransferase [Mucilaginibacter sp.]|uniref:tRNA1(Val) (adenine(37)-N6)-methyltransferase n=1 Tax=Mucilaginibacter sp. TaxID=1882438 RepID=UPI0035BBA052